MYIFITLCYNLKGKLSPEVQVTHMCSTNNSMAICGWVAKVNFAIHGMHEVLGCVVLCLLKQKRMKGTKKEEGRRWENKNERKALAYINNSYMKKNFFLSAFLLFFDSFSSKKKLSFVFRRGPNSNIEIACGRKSEEKVFHLSDCQHLWASICQKIIRKFLVLLNVRWGVTEKCLVSFGVGWVKA